MATRARFLIPTSYGDDVEIETSIAEIGRSSFSLAHRLTKDEGLIDWSQPSRAIHNRVRGLYPWPHAYTFLNGSRLVVLRSRPDDTAVDGPPGTVLSASADAIRVATGRGHLAILELQAEGRRPMPVRDFLAGHPIAPGTRLSSA